MPHILSGARAIGGSVISEEGMAGIGPGPSPND